MRQPFGVCGWSMSFRFPISLLRCFLHSCNIFPSRYNRPHCSDKASQSVRLLPAHHCRHRIASPSCQVGRTQKSRYLEDIRLSNTNRSCISSSTGSCQVNPQPTYATLDQLGRCIWGATETCNTTLLGLTIAWLRVASRSASHLTQNLGYNGGRVS
jgi:hypothetical protein